jgi:S-DNA-T family DNA segregation ATPase FtsK/SpoIIIE
MTSTVESVDVPEPDSEVGNVVPIRRVTAPVTAPDTVAVTETVDRLHVSADRAELEASDGEVLVGELVDRPDGPGDRDSSVPVWRRDPAVRPVLPVWLRSTAELRAAARWAWSHTWRTAAFHTVRLPVYAGTLTARAPRGLARVVGRTLGWVFDAEGRPVRSAVIAANDAATYLKLHDRRNDRVRLRLTTAGVAAVPALAGGVVLATVAPAPAQAAVTAALVALLGVAGAPAVRPRLSRADVAPRAQKLTSDIVIRALGSLGIAQINQALTKGGGITFPAPITRDGPGWRADVDLPYGVTVTDIVERRDKLASGLRRPLGCVWPDPAHDEHAGRLVLWVGDEDLARAKAPAWPLAKRGQVDLFAPVPFGTDPRGRWVSVLFPENNALVGALPGAGKTATVRVLLLAAALDPTAELWVFNLKGNNDLIAAEKVAHRYATGQDDATIEAALIALRDLKAELERRSTVVKGLPIDICPDGKVTRALADTKSLGLHLLVTILDECQNLFAHPVFGKEAGELAEHIIKLGRALGIILILATQRPDANSLPTGVSANVSVRFCLRVMGQVENDMILGTSMYKNGVRASTLRPSDRGIGYLVGAADDPVVVKSAYLDIPTSEAIADRARALRVAAGRLTGYAAGQDTTPEAGPSVSLLDDVLSVWPSGEGKAWSETLTARLAELRPGLYAGWDPEHLAAALKPHRVDTVQIGRRIDGKTINRRGVDRAAVAAAVAERDRRRRTG